MKLIIAGGRNYFLNHEDIAKLDNIHRNGTPVTEVVSGGASGADSCGEKWAKDRGLPVKRFLADWKALGKYAGPRRNHQMAEYADAVALFPGGRGTESMAHWAEVERLEVFDFRKDQKLMDEMWAICADDAKEHEEYVKRGVCSQCGACNRKEAEDKCTATSGITGEYSCAGDDLWPEKDEALTHPQPESQNKE